MLNRAVERRWVTIVSFWPLVPVNIAVSTIRPAFSYDCQYIHAVAVPSLLLNLTFPLFGFSYSLDVFPWPVSGSFTTLSHDMARLFALSLFSTVMVGLISQCVRFPARLACVCGHRHLPGYYGGFYDDQHVLKCFSTTDFHQRSSSTHAVDMTQHIHLSFLDIMTWSIQVNPKHYLTSTSCLPEPAKLR